MPLYTYAHSHSPRDAFLLVTPKASVAIHFKSSDALPGPCTATFRVLFFTTYIRPLLSKPTITHDMEHELKYLRNGKPEASGDEDDGQNSHEGSEAEVESLASLQVPVGNPREFKGRQIQMMALGTKIPFPKFRKECDL